VAYAPQGDAVDGINTAVMTATSKKPAAAATLSLVGEEPGPVVTVAPYTSPSDPSFALWAPAIQSTVFSFTKTNAEQTSTLALVVNGGAPLPPGYLLLWDNCSGTSLVYQGSSCTVALNFSGTCNPTINPTTADLDLQSASTGHSYARVHADCLSP